MEKIYLLESDDKRLQIHCRVKKNKLVCKSVCNTLWLTFSKSVDNRITLEECTFQTGWSYAAALSSAFAPWVRKWLDPCFTMAFYCFMEAKHIDIPYTWSLEYSSRGRSVAWGFGTDQIPCGEIRRFQGTIHEVVIDTICWELENLEASENNILLIYT